MIAELLAMLFASDGWDRRRRGRQVARVRALAKAGTPTEYVMH